MNEIFLVLNNLNTFVKLNFILENNYFKINNDKYSFEIISKEKLRIYNSYIDKVLYTEDSFLYFENISMKEYYLRINLIHNEWYDNIILDKKDNNLIRFNNRDQYGIFKICDNKLIIEWNYWGKEIFIKIDNFNYKQENYDITNYSFKKNNIYIFIHCCSINDGFEILIEQINKIKKLNLYNLIEKIYLSLLGDFNFDDDLFTDSKIEIIFYNSNVLIYEIETINIIKQFCDKLENEAYILYIHNKGANKSGNEDVTKSWRLMMEYFLIDNFDKCLSYLSEYDAIGNNLINKSCYNFDDIKVNDNHSKHFSGNFWWSKKSYITKLKNLDIDYSENAKYTRYRAENWILSDDNCKIGVLFQDYTNTHPYHRYVFDIYRKEIIFVKNENIII